MRQEFRIGRALDNASRHAPRERSRWHLGARGHEGLRGDQRSRAHDRAVKDGGS